MKLTFCCMVAGRKIRAAEEKDFIQNETSRDGKGKRRTNS
jgi:hypothetical protein